MHNRGGIHWNTGTALELEHAGFPSFHGKFHAEKTQDRDKRGGFFGGVADGLAFVIPYLWGTFGDFPRPDLHMRDPKMPPKCPEKRLRSRPDQAVNSTEDHNVGSNSTPDPVISH